MDDYSEYPEILSFEDVKQICGCGHDLALRYITESGAAIGFRVKGSPWRVSKRKLLKYLFG